MRVSEIVNEDLSRRGFLQGAGAAAATAATGAAQAGQFMGIADFGGARFVKEAAKLEKRMVPIVQKLIAASGKDAAVLSKIKYSAESTPGTAEANYRDGTIIVDVSIFYDLPDDALAYTIGHEMGHIVYQHKFGKNTPVQTARQYELQADVYGAKLAYKCGYDPKQAYAEMDAAEKRAKVGGDADHPSYQTRKTHVQKQTGIPVASIQNLQHNKQAIRNFMLA
jgi:Zn-dependent protease with chaperone function